MKAALEQVKRRVLMSIARAVVRAVNDEAGRQQVQIEVMKGELIDAVERMQNYGYTSVPLPGADAGVVFVAGNREQGIVLAIDDRRYRLTGLEPGEVALYDDLGNKVHLMRDRIAIEAVAELKITAPSVIIDGNIATTGTLTNNGVNVGSTHTHDGVQPGGGSTGVPNG